MELKFNSTFIIYVPSQHLQSQLQKQHSVDTYIIDKQHKVKGKLQENTWGKNVIKREANNMRGSKN
jgi:hypothetical protein